MAITQPGGTGTTIRLYDDAGSASGTGYTMAEIAAFCAAVPNTDVAELGTNRKSYRCKVSIQIGDTTQGTATTTWQDTDISVIFDSGKSLTFSGTTNTYLRLGTKVDTGSEASGVSGCDVTLGGAPTWPRNVYIYGCTFRQTSGTFLMASNATDSEAINCMFQSKSTGTAPMSLGGVGGEWGVLYNVDISHTTSAQVLSNFNALAARRLTICAASPTTFIQSGAVGVLVKDISFFGTPTQSDLRWSNGNALNWQLVRPVWSGNADKFSTTAAFGAITADDGAHEYWLYDVKIVDGSTGEGIGSIPLRLTDAQGNIQVDTTSDTTGQISFGTDITANAVIVMDHYLTSTTYTQRHRSPFLLECNLPSMTGYNSNYGWSRYYFDWAGHDSITTSAGTFEDMNDVIVLRQPAGTPTSWVEKEIGP